MLQQRSDLENTESKITDFESHSNKKLTSHEIKLIEYSFFSLCEEVDLFYCEQKEPDLAFETEFT